MISIAKAARRSVEQSLQEAMEEFDRCINDWDNDSVLLALARIEKLEEMLEGME